MNRIFAVFVLLLIYALVFFTFFFDRAKENSLLPDATVNFVSRLLPSEELNPVEGAFTRYEQNNIDVFDRISPSVVFISTLTASRDPLYFGLHQVQQGEGTGFVWDLQGHIVTNFHVIAGAQTIAVRLIDQEQYEAKVVGVSIDKDLAVLRIDAPSEKLNPIALYRGKELKVGQKALAIGNPFGLDHTLTVGVISALGREIVAAGQRRISGVIQTDAAINVGNSGGPLLNATGELIGVNTMIQSDTGDNIGIGFAIPVDLVKKIVPQLIQHGQVKRVGLGITILPDHLKRNYGIRYGVVLFKVVSESPAHKAGLRGMMLDRFNRYTLGDVIVKVGDTEIRDRNDLLDAFENHHHGDQVTLEVLRDKAFVKISVTLEELTSY